MLSGMTSIIYAAAAALAWCTLHSVLIYAWRERPWGRLVYNLVALVSLAAMYAWMRTLPSEALGRWSGLWQILRAALAATALVLGWLGARAHDNSAFLGLRRLRIGLVHELPKLSRTGILGRLRHPWYAAGLLVLPVWPGDFSTVNVAWRGVFMLYLVVGAHLEDRRLERQFGTEFRKYRAEVPGFLPRRH